MCVDAETAALLEVYEALKQFDCIEGDKRSYHTAEDGLQYRYVTLGFRGDDLLKVAVALRHELERAYSLCGTSKPKLYLRSGPAIERDFDTKAWHIRIRIAIPAFNWTAIITKPEGAPAPVCK